MNNKLRLLMLAALAVSSSALATEYRTPYLSDRGPLRHTFKKTHKNKMNINTWSAVYTKEAHKAFLKHSTDTHELTALLFNKETFAFREIFPNSQVPLTSPNYNPFLRTLSYSPRAKYFEWGGNFGGQIDFPVWKEDNGCVKGRIGLRAAIPVRTVEVERQDITPINGTVDQDLSAVVRTGIIHVQNDNNGAPAAAANQKSVFATAYRLDFVNAIRNADGSSVVTPGNGTFKIFGQNIAGNSFANLNAILAFGTEAASGLSAPQIIAWNLDATNANNFDANKGLVGINEYSAIAGNSLTAVEEDKLAFFDNGTDYTPMAGGALDTLDGIEQAWLVFRRATDANNDRCLVDAQSQTIDRMLQDRIRAFNVDALTFLANNGFLFDDYKRSGLGDIDLDVFYEHAFSKSLLAELILGVRFPTGAHKSSCNNPYRAIAKLGNGEHFEIKLGANMSWNACKWFSLKLDLSYNFVLEDKEQRAAVFAGSTVKNIGPCVDADVDWGYFIGRLDFQFVHPKTCSLSTVFGYEFYYKTEDHLTFKTSNAVSWLGTSAPLDNKLARAHTESISHKGRFESSWKPNKWLELFLGGSCVFAGQNAFRDFDSHGGFNVRY